MDIGNNMGAFSSTIAEVFGLTAPDNPLTLARCQPSTAKRGRTMRSITINALAAAACALLLQPAYAQDSASSLSRAEVKAQTRAANEAGELAPAGPLSPESEPKVVKSNKARAPVKAETREAVKAGTIPRGEAPKGAK